MYPCLILPPGLGDALTEPMGPVASQQALMAQVGALVQDLGVLEQAVGTQELSAQRAIAASRTLAAGLRRDLQGTRGFTQVIAAHPRGMSS